MAAERPEDTIASDISADSMIETSIETNYTFDVVADTLPDTSAERENMVTGCLQSSFNAIHDPTKNRILAVEVENHIVVPDTHNRHVAEVSARCT